jgi:pilus assembly protein CpaE
MPNLAHKTLIDPPRAESGNIVRIHRVPQVTIHAFCQTPGMIDTLETAFADRRMSRTHSSAHPGGIAAAISRYQQAVTPNLIIIESRMEGSAVYAELDALADVCDPSTKVIVIGYTNDIELYRELLARGVSEYIVAPVDPVSLIAVIARLYQEAGTKKLGRTIAFVGAKGGVGSSAIAHNVAPTLARLYASDVILADMDLPFGSAGLGFNLDPAQGIEEAIEHAGRVDDVLLERLLAKHGDHLRILTAPAALEHSHDLHESAFERVLEVAQSNVPFVVLDIPHVWTSWTKSTLLAADEVVITATPDLASLRNAKNLVDLLKEARRNDGPPKLVLNQVGVPKRSEINPDKFAAALQIKPMACIPFDPGAFSTASNEGRMIADVSAKAAVRNGFDEIAQTVSGRARPKNSGNGRFSLAGLWRS